MIIDFIGGFEAQSQSGAVAQLIGNAVALPLGDAAEVGSLGEILTYGMSVPWPVEINRDKASETATQFRYLPGLLDLHSIKTGIVGRGIVDELDVVVTGNGTAQRGPMGVLQGVFVLHLIIESGLSRE